MILKTLSKTLNITQQDHKKNKLIIIIIIETKIVSKQNLFSWPVNDIETVKFNFVILAVST